MSNLKNIFLRRKDAISTLGDQIMVSGGNFLTIAICANLLPLAEQGKLTYVFATYMGLLLLNVAAIHQGAGVRAPKEDSSYHSTLIKLQTALALSAALAACVFWGSLGRQLGWEVLPEELIFLFLFLALQQLADFRRRAAYIFSTSSMAMLTSFAVYLPRLILIAAVGISSVQEVLIVMALSAGFPAIANFRGMEGPSENSENTWLKKAIEHLAYSRLFILGAPLAWMWSYIPIFLLGAIQGKEEAALLASIRGVSNIANVLMEQLETKVVADWARSREAMGEQSVQQSSTKLFRTGVTLWFIVFLVVIFCGDKIISIILGNAYEPYWKILVIAWFGYGMYFVSRLLGMKYRVFGSNRIEFIANAIGATVAIVASLILVPHMSTIGAAWVYVLIPTAMIAGQLYFMRTDNR